jgi:myo-inositol catabolism protein IolC
MPPVDRAVMGSDHSIWLGRPSAVPGAHYLVLDERGDAIGTVTLPPRSIIAAADRTTLWTIEPDDDDVPSVVRYQVRGAR